MMKNSISIFFAFLIVIFTGYFIGNGLYVNLVYLIDFKASYLTFIPFQILSILTALYFKKEIIKKFTKKG